MIPVVAAVAMPNLLRSYTAANEASAVGTIRTINLAQVTYQVAYPTPGYAANLRNLWTNHAPRAGPHGTCRTDGRFAVFGGLRRGRLVYEIRLSLPAGERLQRQRLLGLGRDRYASVQQNRYTKLLLQVGWDHSLEWKLTNPLTVAGCQKWEPLR